VIFFEDNYINIHQQININLSADGQPIIFVEASGGPRLVCRYWLIHLIGIACSKECFSIDMKKSENKFQFFSIDVRNLKKTISK